MTQDKPHNDNRLQEIMDNHLGSASVAWSKSRGEVWNDLQSKAAKKRTSKRRIYFTTSIAAAILLLAGITLFMRLYTLSAFTDNGEHLLVSLPDGSEVELNAGSSISWHPYWWRINRDADFEGEGFFMVKKGSSFTVVSEKGSTTVLGTSFNIYAREEQYKVTCFTGKVRAEASVTNQQVVINPGEQAVLQPSGTFQLQAETPVREISGWRNYMFTFTGTELSEVWEEIMRQYNITIEYTVNSHRYTGFFSKSMDAETVLDLVCRAFGFTFVKTKARTYVISENGTNQQN